MNLQIKQIEWGEVSILELKAALDTSFKRNRWNFEHVTMTTTINPSKCNNIIQEQIGKFTNVNISVNILYLPLSSLLQKRTTGYRGKNETQQIITFYIYDLKP